VDFKSEFGAVVSGLLEGVLFGGFERHEALVAEMF
jgi:hypothetical protein